MLNKVISYYSNCLPPFLFNSIFCGFITGLETKSNGPIEKAEHMVSYITYGIIHGVLYPGCVFYTLYKNIKNIKD